MQISLKWKLLGRNFKNQLTLPDGHRIIKHIEIVIQTNAMMGVIECQCSLESRRVVEVGELGRRVHSGAADDKS